MDANRYGEQGLCFVDAKDPQLMNLIFDQLGPETREMLRGCPYDLCLACFSEILHYHRRNGRDQTAKETAGIAINEMIQRIRCTEGQN